MRPLTRPACCVSYAAMALAVELVHGHGGLDQPNFDVSSRGWGPGIRSSKSCRPSSMAAARSSPWVAKWLPGGPFGRFPQVGAATADAMWEWWRCGRKRAW
jgi:hypothetical protein